MELDDQMGRCQYQYCKQRDFLPFECGLCKMKYCLEHKEQANHECPKEAVSRKAVVCLKCSVTLHYFSNQKGDEILAAHKCQPNAVQQTRLKQCPSCNTKLTFTNTYLCKTCQQEVCLKHRMPEDHECSLVKKPETSQLCFRCKIKTNQRCRHCRQPVCSAHQDQNAHDCRVVSGEQQACCCCVM